MSKKYFIFLFALLAVSNGMVGQRIYSEVNIIPRPQVVRMDSGSFRFTSETKIVIPQMEFRKIASFIKDPFKQAANISLNVIGHSPTENFILFRRDKNLKPENYRLSIQHDRVFIYASDYNGFFYGVQTVKQLLPAQIFSKTVVSKTEWTIPVGEIEDGPRFHYRGLMLDVSRHFFSINYIKEVVYRMAEHKINRLHFHAIDDQGWRIEIKKYPRLTQIGAYRAESRLLTWNEVVANRPDQYPNYGGFYTQNQIIDLVQYAADRGIQIIPEIEMPGHVTSAVASYPFLSCTGQQVLVPNGGVLPPFLNVLCAGSESTYAFMKNVLTEIAKIFPSAYIHVGGDEVTKTHWKQCPNCQKKIKEEKLKNVEELESYFMMRIRNIVKDLDKKMIIWNEQNGTPEGVISMIYKNVNEVPSVTQQGYEVIVAPASHTYFDFYQGMPEQEPLAYGGHTYLSRVYSFDPASDKLDVKQQSRVLGGQANLWAEFVHNEQTSEYMLYPRLAALSESVWSLASRKDWTDFSQRMMTQYDRYAFANLNFARSALNVNYKIERDKEKKSAKLSLQTEFPTVDIRFAINENVTATSPIYKDSILLKQDTEISARTFSGDQPVGKLLKIKVEIQ
ncbi:MAG: beta-N-acetylhexosaminidase [Ginsengibacter sp.]